MTYRLLGWSCPSVLLIATSLPLFADDALKPSAKVVINKYCTTCHNARLKTAGLQLDTVDVEHVGERADLWEKVARKLRTGEMPPAGLPRPDKATYAGVAAELETKLDAAALAKPNPGRVAVHRLNRAEYTAAVRDLLGLDIDGKALLSADDADQEGFDNVASVLSVSPVLLENYLSAARKISRIAVGDLTLRPAVDTYKYSKLLIQDDQMSDDLPFGSQGGALIRYHFPLDGEYTVKVQLRREHYDYLVGMGEPHEIDIRLDGVRVKRFKVGGEAKGMTTPENFAGNTQGSPEYEVYMHTADAGLEARIPVKAGQHEVAVSFVRRFWEPEGVLQPPQIGFGRTTNEYYHGNPSVEYVYIGGPYGTTAHGDSLSRRKVFVCTPKDAADEEPCARKILSTLATRAYRRPATDDEVKTLLSFYQAGREEKDFDEGIQKGLERILAAPSFLFRVERVPAKVTAGSAYRLSDLDLASRLSFFLWSSIPDDELRNLGIRGRLKEPKVLEQQVQRMLRDPRSRALVDGFANRWLGLSKLAGIVPDTDLYREFDENLRDGMAKETQIFVASQLQEDRNVVELLTADYTYVNERMAKHYGIPNIYGDRFRRVKFTDGVRGGCLGKRAYWPSPLTRIGHPLQSAAGTYWRICWALRRRLRRRTSRRSRTRVPTVCPGRCANAWNCIVRTRSALPAISAWIRWDLPLRILTRSVNIARKAMARRSTHPHHCLMAHAFKALVACVRCWQATKKILFARSRRSC